MTQDVYEHSMDRIKEMQEINWSLGCLKECIRSLFLRETSEPNTMIKFRNSKLTLLLRDVFLPGAQQRTVFIACVAPLARDWKHSRSTLGYTSKLKLIDDVHTGRSATEVELLDGLLAFYQQKARHLATKAKAKEILCKFVGREVQLYHKLAAKYRDAPTVLLLAPKVGKKGKISVDEPGKWNRKQVKAFVNAAIGKVYADRFNITGSQMLSLDNKAFQRRCGARWSCAAFSDKLVEDDGALSEEALAAEQAAADAAEAAGQVLWDRWSDKVRAAKAVNSRLRGAGSGFQAGGGGGAAGGGAAAGSKTRFHAGFDVPINITVLTPELAPGGSRLPPPAVAAAEHDAPAAVLAAGGSGGSGGDEEPVVPSIHPAQYLD